MRREEQTSIHLLMAGTVTMFSVVLSLIIVGISWELWMVPLLAVGCLVVWWLHIGKDMYRDGADGILFLRGT